MSASTDKDGFPEYHNEWDPKPKPKRQPASGTPWYIGCLAGVGLLAVLGCVCGVGMAFWLTLVLNEAETHIERTFEAAKNEPQLQQALGQPIEQSAPFDNSIQMHQEDGETTMEVEYGIEGPLGEGRVHFRAIKRGNRWTYPESYVEVQGMEEQIPLRIAPFIQAEE